MCLNDQQLLDVWVQGQGYAPIEQSLLLLNCAQSQLIASSSNLSREQLADFSLGHREALLLQLRSLLFGPNLTGMLPCPQCASPTLLEFSSQQLLQHYSAEPESYRSFQHQQWHIEFRLPSSNDMQAIAQSKSQHHAAETLLLRCVTRAAIGNEVIDPQQLPPGIIELVESEMSRLDPLADTQLDCQCPDCGHRWQTALDMGTFLWAEISAWARGVLRQVHGLASAYGWSEQAILAMSSVRRQLYLDMINYE